MSAAEEVKVCSCGREPGYMACSHVSEGSISDIQISGDAATCSECSKLKPDDTFAPICTRCLDKLSGPPDPQGDLQKILAEEAELTDVVQKAQAQLMEREALKRDLQRRLANDYVEAFFMALKEFVKDFLPEGYVAERYQALQELFNHIQANDPRWPDSLSTDAYADVVNRADPEELYLATLVREGGFAGDKTLADTLSRIFRKKADASPFWED